MPKTKHEGGRTPLEPGKKARVIGFSVSESEYQEFMALTERFEGTEQGAISRMFRRILRGWKNSMQQVLGEDVDEKTA